MPQHSVIMSSIENRENKESIKNMLRFNMSTKSNSKWLKLVKESEKELLQLIEPK